MKSSVRGVRMPTQRQIAELAGVSREAVSHILNGTTAKPYSAETRRRVLDAAKQLKYRPNRAAQLMRNGRSRSVGILSFNVMRFLAQRKVQAAANALGELGYHWVVEEAAWHQFPETTEEQAAEEAVGSLLDARVEGVVLVYPSEAMTQAMVDRLVAAGIPVVAVAGDHLRGIPNFVSDRPWGYEQITRHLLRHGYRRLLLLGNDNAAPRQGFRAALADDPDARKYAEIHVVPDLRQDPAPPAEESGYFPGFYGMEEILQRATRPDVVVCPNDHWALGALTACTRAGLRVPEDLAITGFDNDPAGRFGAVPLTTMDHPSEEISRRAVQHLVQLIQDKRPPKEETISIRGTLIVRHSCGTTHGFHPGGC